MQFLRPIAAAVLVAGLVTLSWPHVSAADEKKPVNVPAARTGGTATDALPTPRGPALAFDGPGDPKSGDAPPPRDRAGRPRDGKDAGKPDDNDEGPGPGGPGGGPGGPGRRAGEPARRPGGPMGDDGPPRDGRGPGPGSKPGERLGPDGRRPGGSEAGDSGRADPEMAELLKQDRELDKQSNDLAAQYRNASKDEKEKLQKEILETVNKHFDVRQQRRKLQLDRMQKELERLRTEIDHRTDQRETLIKGRVQELIGDGGPGF